MKGRPAARTGPANNAAMRWPMQAARMPTHRRRASRAVAVPQSIATTFVMHAMVMRPPRQLAVPLPDTYRKIAQALNKQGVASSRGVNGVHTALCPATNRVGMPGNPMYANRPVWNLTKWLHHPHFWATRSNRASGV